MNSNQIRDFDSHDLEALVVKHGYRGNKKMPDRIEMFKEEAAEFIEFRNNSEGKTILEKPFMDILFIQKEAIEVKFGDYIRQTEHQKALYYERDVTYNGETYNIECKSLLDMYGDGIITDLKRTALPLDMFPWTCLKFRYDFQLEFYRQALEICGEKATDTKILVVSDKDPRNPRLFNISKQQRRAAINGEWNRGRYYGSIDEAFERFIYYSDTRYTIDYDIRMDDLILFDNDKTYRNED